MSTKKDSISPLPTSDSLGLTNVFITPSLDSLSQLPDLTWKDPSSVERCIEIFEHMQRGGKEHLATMALLAQARHSLGHYEKATKALDSLQSHLKHDSMNQSLLNIARSKILFTKGDFTQALDIAETALEQPNSQSHPLHYASMLTSKALCQLLLCRDLEDAFSIRDHSRIALRFVEQYASSPVSRAAAQLNYGVAEAYFRQLVSDADRNRDAPMDPALRAWKQGLTELKRSKGQDATAFLESRLQSNMAWGLLCLNNTDRASDFTKQALAICDAWPEGKWKKEGLHRALTLTAQCYHQAGSAVTSEGLFQSALDQIPVHPQEILELVECYHRYADLLSEWERREKQGVQYQEKATRLAAKLPDPWKGRSVVCASLWFWTPSDLAVV